MDQDANIGDLRLKPQLTGAARFRTTAARACIAVALLSATGCSIQLAEKPGSRDEIAAQALMDAGADLEALDRIEQALRSAEDPELRARLLHDRAGILIRTSSGDRDRIIADLRTSYDLGHDPAGVSLADFLASDPASPAELELAADLYLEAYPRDPQAAIRLADLIRANVVNRPGVSADRLVAMAVEQLRSRAAAGDARASRDLGRLVRDGVLGAGNTGLAESYMSTAIVNGEESAVVELARMWLDSGDPGKVARARLMLEDAANQGSTASMVALARGYQDGAFGRVELAQTRFWYERAVDAGLTAHAVTLASLVLEEEQPAASDVVQAVAVLDQWVVRGDPRAAMARASMHADGLGGPVDDQAAARLYQIAADSGHVDGIIALARAYSEGRGVQADAPRAVGLWQRAVDLGSQAPLLDLGLAYAEGHGVARDPHKAEELLRRASDGGSIRATVALARLYEAGVDGVPDPARALPLYRQVAEQGSLSAIRWVADYYDRPGAHEADLAEAARWLRQAADQGEPWAMFRLAQAYGRGRGVDRDSTTATQWIERFAASEPGNAARIARAYQDGSLGADDAYRAFGWYQRAAQGGDVRAMRVLAEAYENGQWVAADSSAAADWMRRAAAAGDTAAAERLAQQLFATGRPDDVSEAFALWRRAAAGGSIVAMREVANALATGLAGEVDVAGAAEWYQRAAAAGDGESQYRLGIMYLQGYGVPVDSEKAMEWLQRAARNNVHMAAVTLESLATAAE